MPRTRLKVGMIGHASLVITTTDVKCLMDPVLVDPFEAGANTFEPPVRLRPKQLIDLDGRNLRDPLTQI